MVRNAVLNFFHFFQDFAVFSSYFVLNTHVGEMGGKTSQQGLYSMQAVTWFRYKSSEIKKKG